eukprot:CAMPEP_0119068546 /NCGR_PEP_ID=MMETSP1178-20130426/10994_1 /TAXON_ID=33656 /ORGANISM="unid sp, Strain CCMP2000" /LENGTH=61 /DNA_ID=CAMNT_0007050261 /DNA_START=8 /DNA_END=193 /DNA_ORIENTATION=+
MGRRVMDKCCRHASAQQPAVPPSTVPQSGAGCNVPGGIAEVGENAALVPPEDDHEEGVRRP